MSRIDVVWLTVAPMDMRAGMKTALVRVVTVFNSAQSHHASLFANRRANRIKVLVHDSVGIWLALRDCSGAVRLAENTAASRYGPFST